MLQIWDYSRCTNLNSDVKSERSSYLDLGVTHQLSSALSLGVDGYYKDITNMLDEGQFGNALIYSPFNYSRGKIYGVELTASYKKGNFSGYVNLARSTSLAKNIISSQYNFGISELNYIKDHWVHTDHDQTYTGSFGVAYDWSEIHWSMDSIYGSGLRKGFANTDHLPSYIQFNVSASKKIQSEELGNFEVRMVVVNLLDNAYELRDGSGIGVGAPQYGPRRGLFFGISKSF